MATKTSGFTHDRFGLFIHWGLYAIPARGEWVQSKEQISEEAYAGYFRAFSPDRFDAHTWAKLAKAAGMKYAVLTAKHHEGFCLWDSALTDFKATNTGDKHDLIKEYVEAFRAEGLKVGLYYSLLDWHHPEYTVDFHHPLRDLPETDPRRRSVGENARTLAKYVDYLHGQVRELLTHYGRIDLLWFDFSFGDKRGEAWRANDLVKMVRELQPDILMNNRLTGAHDYAAENALGEITTPEQLIPHTGVTDASGSPMVWEACITLNDHWGYARDDRNFKTAAEVVRMLVECVSKGGNLLLNVGPNARGEIQPEARRVLRDVGAWMDANAESITGAGPALLDGKILPKPDWGRYTWKGGVLYAHVFERPMGPLLLTALGGRVKRAWFVADGSELSLTRPWNVPENTTDLFITLPRTPLLDVLDTVIALELQSPRI